MRLCLRKYITTYTKEFVNIKNSCMAINVIVLPSNEVFLGKYKLTKLTEESRILDYRRNSVRFLRIIPMEKCLNGYPLVSSQPLKYRHFPWWSNIFIAETKKRLSYFVSQTYHTMMICLHREQTESVPVANMLIPMHSPSNSFISCFPTLNKHLYIFIPLWLLSQTCL